MSESGWEPILKSLKSIDCAMDVIRPQQFCLAVSGKVTYRRLHHFKTLVCKESLGILSIYYYCSENEIHLNKV